MQVMHHNRKHDPKESSFRGLLNYTRQNAKQRGYEFDIPLELFIDLVSSPCYWCGSEPFQSYNVAISRNGYSQRLGRTEQTELGWVKYNGIDRIDNKSGYRADNVLPCCKWCNFARNARTVDEFKEWLRMIAERYSHDLVAA